MDGAMKGVGSVHVGDVSVGLALDTATFDKAVSKSVKRVSKDYSKAFTSVETKASNVFKKIGKLVLASGAIAGFVSFSKSAINLGSDLQEVQNVVDVTFGSMSGAVDKFAQSAIENAGLSETVAKQYMGTFGAMNKAFGFTTEQTLGMSKAITQLTGDVASFYNISSDEAAVKLKSIWTGETESLKDLGVVMTQTSLDQYALANGFGKTTSEMSEQEKVALRYAFVQDKLSLANGDFVRTQDGWANQTRVLTLRWQQFMATIGQGLINILSPLVKMINIVVGKLQILANIFKKFTTAIFGNANSDDTDLSNLSDGLGNVGTSAENTADSVAKASKKMKRSLSSVDEINTLGNNKSSGSDNDSSGISDQVLNASGIGKLALGDYGTTLDNYDKRIDSTIEKMKEGFSSTKQVAYEIWNSDPIQSFVGATTSAGNFLLDFGKTIGEDFVNDCTATWENIKENVGTTLSNTAQLWTDFWTDIQNGIDTWGTPIINGVSDLFNSIWQDGMDPALQVASKIFADFTGSLVDIWDEYGATIIDDIGEFCKKTVDLFQAIWDDILEPIITPFLETLSWLWEKHIKGMIKEVGKFIAKLITAALEIYNKFVDPIIKILEENLAPAWSFLSTTIIGGIGTVLAYISDGVKVIFKVFGGIIDFLTGVFTGNWKRAWQGIVNIFTGLVDGLVAGIKLPLNLMIDLLNGFIAGINKIRMPSWVPGLGGMGFNIKRIPKLAEGGYARANNPKLAIVGDNKREGEIIAPESKIYDQTKKAIADSGGIVGKQQLEITIYHKYEDGKTIIQKVNQAQIDAGKILLLT